MGRVIHTIAVPEDSFCNAVLKKWRIEGVNISARVCMLIEESNHLTEKILALERKISYIMYMTNHRSLNREDWEEIFEGYDMYSPYSKGEVLGFHPNQQTLDVVGEEE
jgi:hypothetical protein